VKSSRPMQQSSSAASVSDSYRSCVVLFVAVRRSMWSISKPDFFLPRRRARLGPASHFTLVRPLSVGNCCAGHLQGRPDYKTARPARKCNNTATNNDYLPSSTCSFSRQDIASLVASFRRLFEPVAKLATLHQSRRKMTTH
jgi:hypothetical protein